jgi:hypothetical protein
MRHPRVTAAAVALGSLAFAVAPARADGPLSIGVGPSIAFQSQARRSGGTDQLNINLALDLGSTKHFPLRNSLMFDYAGGAANGGSLSEYGLGFGTRLNAPTYVGGGAFLYSVNLNGGSAGGPHSSTGFGSNIFAGRRILEVPGGVAFAVQLTYRQLPVVSGVNPSGLGLTFRVSL